MTDEQNRRLVEDYMTAWANADATKLQNLIAGNAKFNNPPPGVTPDRNGAITMAKQYREGFPDLKIRFGTWVVQGNNVAVSFVGSGTHKGTFMGIEPTNVHVDTPGIAIVVCKDGKVVEDTTSYDALGLFTQLGAVPPLGEGLAETGANPSASPSRTRTEEKPKVAGYR